MFSKKTTKWLLLFCLVIIAAVAAWLQYSGQLAKDNGQARTTCSSGAPLHTDLPRSESAELRKLADYETLCQGAVVDKLMIFAAMPSTEAEGVRQADDMARKLKEFSARGISPLVIFEPSLTSPTILHDISTGTYDEILGNYFASLKAQGVTDQQMGTWVLFPEANTPLWHTTNPKIYGMNVTKVATMQKRIFPASQTSLLLNSHTYPDNDAAWDHGKTGSLLPYIKDVPSGLIDSIGYQGFPYMSPANSTTSASQLEAKDFMPGHLVVEIARRLGVSRIWLNTGTFLHKYTNNPAERVELKPTQREMTLASILREAIALKEQSLKVSINLFAADKSDTAEQVDWSYWQEDAPGESQDARALDLFIRQVRANQLEFSLYDYDHSN